MSWAKLDDAMGEHRKIKRALRKNRPAIALHFLGILHCSRYLTDGFVEDEYIDEVLPARERNLALATLVEHGMWEEADGGYRIHDYLAHNPTRAKVLAQRAADAERKARGRSSESRGKPDVQPPSIRTPNGQPPDSGGTPDGIREESARPVPSRPVPSVPPSPPGGKRDGIEKKAADLGFEEWLLDHHSVTGKTIPKAGTQTRTKLAGQFVACCAELPEGAVALPELKLATRAAFHDPHRNTNGYDGAENVLRPTKVLNLIDNGRKLAKGQLGASDRPATLAEIHAAERRSAA